jgi:hypothetical protein
MWVPGEPVLYIGLAGTNLAERIGHYYRTPLGARAPHAGGWPLKTLTDLQELYVHWATVDDPAWTELAVLDAFIAGVSEAERAKLVDPHLPLPFANLQRAPGERKQHGIGGARASRTTGAVIETGAVEAPPPTGTMPVSQIGSDIVTQRVTLKDSERGIIRLPRAAKHLFPSSRSTISISMRGLQLDVDYDPRSGPDRDRSGVLRIGRQALQSRVLPGERLVVALVGQRVHLD